MPSLTQFRESFITDIARPKLFDVIMPPPIGLMDYKDIARNLTFRCESTQFPSRTLATTEQKFGTNPTEKHAYHSTYNDLEMTFIVSEDMSERKFFDAWLNLINPTSSFDFNYRNNYITDFYVYQYDGAVSKTTYSIALIDAFPISVNQLDLDWSNDSYHKLSVTFAYRYWQIIDPEQLAKQALKISENAITNGFPDRAGLPGQTTNLGNYPPSMYARSDSPLVDLSYYPSDFRNSSPAYPTSLSFNPGVDRNSSPAVPIPRGVNPLDSSPVSSPNVGGSIDANRTSKLLKFYNTTPQ